MVLHLQHHNRAGLDGKCHWRGRGLAGAWGVLRCLRRACAAPPLLHPTRPPTLLPAPSDPQINSPCLLPDSTDLTAPRLVLPPGTLPAATGRTYRIALSAAKGSRSDTDSATVRVLEGAAPVGKIRWVGRCGRFRVCGSGRLVPTPGR